MSKPKKVADRETLCPKDIRRFAGCCTRTARAKLDEVRRALSKGKNAMITIPEFCEFHKIDEDYFRSIIR